MVITNKDIIEALQKSQPWPSGATYVVSHEMRDAIIAALQPKEPPKKKRITREEVPKVTGKAPE